MFKLSLSQSAQGHAASSHASGAQGFTALQARGFIERLKSFYGAEFNRKWAGVQPAMLEETICASFRAVSPEQLARCFKRISTSSCDFCPSIPTLLAWCFEGEFLSDLEAYRRAGDERITDPLVYETVRRIGFWDMRHKAESQMRPVFMEVYKAVKGEYMGGARFAIPKAIAAPKSIFEPETAAQKAARQACAAQAIAQMRGQMGKECRA
ncbi:hypothetical protein [Aquirhabdus parva]|uniref:Uncharacterized protein n=1 Tax=Aquirhabdus parva TaxID=2283318 RepID=A0A345P9C3_9GAMM|nr:hypothetical protein [Aquirhabdus parva]AXI03882.1 hypothetical protein HYN46_14165 [Aquirhabdus parva]